jgi:hypothetical protein
MTSSEAGGRFVLRNLPDGRYRVVAGGSDLLGLSVSEFGLVAVDGVEVAGNEADAGKLRLPAAATIAGVVRDAEGRQVIGASIFLRRADSSGDYLQRLSSCHTDGGGSYQYQGVAPGSYDVVCQAPGYAQAQQAGVRVAEGSTAEVDLVLLGGTEVFAILGSTAGFDPTALDVEVVDAAGKVVSGLLGFADLAPQLFQSLAPGEYYLGTFAAGKYTVRGEYQGKGFTASETLAGEAEKRIPLSLP